MTEQKPTSFISVFVKGFLLFCGLALIAIVVFFYVILPTPPNRTNFKLFSSDKNRCVSIITMGDTRYIINGNHSTVPKSDYIKLDISSISSLGDEIGVCWNNGKYQWEIVNDKAKIIDIQLDTLIYRFHTNWEEDEHGIPNSKKYHKPNCGTIGLLNMKNYDDAIILEN
ncbi:hypothetical protein [uncultured Zobellia sp.]|uniref:hypothetical protein n=1 Tax=uncultured Zobellia sp. TaxID=255433 RepID=UPI0025913BE8|nr:hypothetical protein [uncultured Zobellia sp.]